MTEFTSALRIAVIIPCFNESGAIGKVATDFARVLPKAEIYVFDNNSTDDSVDEAQRAGAIVRFEKRQGKGFVVRRMFADIEADIYLMVDGDDTYDADAAPRLVSRLIEDNLDMVNAVRANQAKGAYRPGHYFGNRILTGMVRLIFGDDFTDMLSGYRVFSRRFVKSFPQTSGGFEIETELTVHALELSMPVAEETTDYSERADGTQSKLRTYSDGFRILWAIFQLLKQERPLKTFAIAGLIFFIVSLVLAYPIFSEYLETGLVPRFPTAILSTGLSLVACLSLACGLILDTVTRGRQEVKRISYLGVHSVLGSLEYEAPRNTAFRESQ